MTLRRLQDAPQIVDAGGPVHVEPELGELQRDVALDPGRDNGVEDPKVLARRLAGLVEHGHAFAEVVEREEQSAAL